MSTTIDQNIPRRESWSKVTGEAVYTDDMPVTGHLTARLCTSEYPSARISAIYKEEALAEKGVHAVVTGRDYPVLTGPLLEDRPPLAIDVVRYAGEPVAIVIAADEAAALRGVRKLKIEYEKLPAVMTPAAALKTDAPLLHRNAIFYHPVVDDVQPVQLTNINSSWQIRKGTIETGFRNSMHIIEKKFHLPPSDHLAMEVRTARAEISKQGIVKITASSQAPYTVAKQISSAFQIPAGNIEVQVPFVGGGFGGKAPLMPEVLAYIASRSVQGRPVRLVLTREQDMASAPSRLGLDAVVRLGADAAGHIQAADLTFLIDCGAYADIAPYMTKAIAADCTGPYRIANVRCNASCVYTNHTYATSYRGFAHESYTYCIERTVDALAAACQTDPVTFRMKNAIGPGATSPTGAIITTSSAGDVYQCLEQLKTQLAGEQLTPHRTDPHTIRSVGISCFWKAANPPVNAVSGAFLTFNPDGSLNLNTGVVEMGNGSQSHLAQMLADRMHMDIRQIHVSMGVNTRLNPEHYKTVASLTTYMAGHAVLRAADDVLAQLRQLGSLAFSCPPEEIEISNSQVFARNNPADSIAFQDIAAGYLNKQTFETGAPVLGRGSFVLKDLTPLSPSDGRGRSGPAWTPGAQAVVTELDTATYTYRIVKAYTVMDVGRAINPSAMKESIRGGMAMGLSMASREHYSWARRGRLSTPNLRSYKLLHIGEEPEYHVQLTETPQDDAPYGTRSMSEHGIIGMPAALANALASATNLDITTLPVTPEYLWEHRKEIRYDCK